MSSTVHHPVSLRALTTEDASVMARWGEDLEFCRAAGWSVGAPLVERELFFARLVCTMPPGLIRLAAIHDGVLVGYVDLRGTDADVRELGFVVGEQVNWGRGLGRSIAGAGCAFGFERLGLGSIWAVADATNHASIKVLEALGMTPLADGVATDVCRLSISRQDWKN